MHPQEACQGGHDCRVQLHPTQALHTLASQQRHTHQPLPLALSLGRWPSPPPRTTRPPTAHHTSKGTEAARAVTVRVSSTGPDFSQESSASCQVCLKLMEAISRPRRCVANLGCGEQAHQGVHIPATDGRRCHHLSRQFSPMEPGGGHDPGACSSA